MPLTCSLALPCCVHTLLVPQCPGCSCTRLDLSSNRFERLPRTLAQATRLQHLSLGPNPLLLNASAMRLLAGLPALAHVVLP